MNELKINPNVDEYNENDDAEPDISIEDYWSQYD